MKRVFVLAGLALLAVPLLPMFGGCGITTNVDLGGDAGLIKEDGAVPLDAAGCWQAGKYCDVNGTNTCVSNSETQYGCGSGACDPCIIPFATAKCGADGQCEIDTCEAGYADCDISSITHHATGCETNIAANPSACGKCGVNCYDDTASDDWGCDSGVCKPINCSDPNTTECDFNDGITCETNKTTTDNCGFCTNKCQAANAQDACSANATAPGGFSCTFTCNQGYYDCDGLPQNGCEINLTNDKENCGTCGVNCDTQLGTAHGTTQCTNGTCEIVCDPAWGDCSAGGGCETAIVSTSDCGGCGQTCAPAHATGATCATKTCSYASCSSGYDDCDGNKPNGCETQTNTATHCGSCNGTCTNPPNGSGNCSTGSCVKSCNMNFADCDSDPNTCEPLNTSANCNGCNKPCNPVANATASCATYSCVQTCKSTFKDCDNNINNGCEALGTNQNCSDCGDACAGTKVCLGGICKCPTGQSDCSGTCIDVNGSDKNNCGSCGHKCAGPATCVSGTCTCSPGTYCDNVGCCVSPKTCQGAACVCPSGNVECGGTCYPGNCCSNGDCSGSTPKCCSGASEDHTCHWSGHTC